MSECVRERVTNLNAIYFFAQMKQRETSATQQRKQLMKMCIVWVCVSVCASLKLSQRKTGKLLHIKKSRRKYVAASGQSKSKRTVSVSVCACRFCVTVFDRTHLQRRVRTHIYLYIHTCLKKCASYPEPKQWKTPQKKTTKTRSINSEDERKWETEKSGRAGA